MLRLITWAEDGNVHLTIDGVIYKGFFVKAYDGFGEKFRDFYCTFRGWCCNLGKWIKSKIRGGKYYV